MKALEHLYVSLKVCRLARSGFGTPVPIPPWYEGYPNRGRPCPACGKFVGPLLNDIRFAWRFLPTMVDFYFECSIMLVSERARLAMQKARLTGVRFTEAKCWIDPGIGFDVSSRRWIVPSVWRMHVDEEATFEPDSRLQVRETCGICKSVERTDCGVGDIRFGAETLERDVSRHCHGGLIVSPLFQQVVKENDLTCIAFIPLIDLDEWWQNERFNTVATLNNHAKSRAILVTPGDEAGDDSPYEDALWTDDD